MLIFCRRIIVNKRELLHTNGPLLLASNHPNSFLDGIILDILFEQPVWALARGDVFKKPLYKKLLKAIRLLPVYRTSEGVENVPINYQTFDACMAIFRDHGIVQIFSEGRCINEWHLRPLKKGTARLVMNSWNDDIPLRVLPVGINYSAFRRFGKNIFIHFGEMISRDDISMSETEGKRYLQFNNLLQAQLQSLVFEIDKKNMARQRQLLEIKPTLSQKILLGIPAIPGFLLHAPLYLPVKRFVWKRCNHNDHYDSVLAALLLFSYPFYLLGITLLVFFIFKSYFAFSLLLLLPFTAWSYVQLKGQLDKSPG